jgi:hypothetical protein
MLPDYGLDHFVEFINARRKNIKEKLKSISM